MSVNKVILVGNLGADPEVKTLPSGSQVANFSIATSNKYKDKSGELQERTEWHRITAYGKQAELAGKYLSKGRQVFVEGRISYRTAEKDGVTRYFTDIIVNQITFLGRKQDAERTNGLDADAEGGERLVPRNFNPMEAAGDEEIPF